MALEEKGLKYRVIEENLSYPSEGLLNLNPTGEVPRFPKKRLHLVFRHRLAPVVDASGLESLMLGHTFQSALAWEDTFLCTVLVPYRK